MITNMITKRNIILLVGVLLIFSGCSPSFNYTWTKPDYKVKDYTKIAVYALSKNDQIKTNFEIQLVEQLSAMGYEAVPGSQYKKLNGQDSVDQAVLEDKLIEDNVDAVITYAVLDREDHNHFGRTGVAFPTYYSYWGGYFVTTYNTIYQPGYYQNYSTYVVENNFYELPETASRSKNLVWSGQTKLSSPDHSVTYVSELVERLANKLVADKILMSQK